MGSLKLFPTTKVIFIDPSISVTGYSVWKLEVLEKTQALLFFGSIRAKSGRNKPSLIDSIDFMVESVNNVAVKAKAAIGAVEIPPQTMYGQGNLGRKQIIGKATNLMKLAGVSYSIYATLKTKQRDTFLPVSWQSKLRSVLKMPRGTSSKDRSLRYANDLVFPLEIYRGEIKCHNTADAICMGYFMSKLYISQQYK